MTNDSSSLVSGTTLVQSISQPISDTQPVFQRALDDYIQNLPENKRKHKFINQCIQSGATPQTIHEAIQKVEQKKASKNNVSKVINRIVNVLKDYSGIIDLLVSANPLPCAIIWGGLRVIIEGTQRYYQLFETITAELRSLALQITRINMVSELYGQSKDLQDVFFDSYKNMIRFWHRVDLECDRCFFEKAFRSATSFSTKKLNQIIEDLKDNADQIDMLTPLVEAGLAKQERTEAKSERHDAGMERVRSETERQAASDWRALQKVDRQFEHYRQVSGWLSTENSNESILTRHRRRLLSGTCEWLLQHHYYGAWVDGTLQPSIMWVRAPPGYGKSVLCSFAIRSIQTNYPDAAVAYHFCQYDQPYVANDVLRILCGQVFQKYWENAEQVDEQIYCLTQRSSCSVEPLGAMLKLLVPKFSRFFIFIDGLDEEQESLRWSEISIVIDYLTALATTYPDRVRIWYSSQPRTSIAEQLGGSSTVVDIKGHGAQDVSLFLSRAIPELDELDNAGVVQLDNLVERADGNFLWADLMVKSLRKEANSLREMEQLVKNGLPTELDGYYQRIFDRIEKPRRALACKIFSLLVFARRRLRVGEIREAVALLTSNMPVTDISSEDLPFVSRLHDIFSPLIEVADEDDQKENERSCYFTHSSVRNFLWCHRNVLGSDLRITPSTIANACLLYLNQPRYSKPVKRQGPLWFDSMGQSVEEHKFILYAAKYWDKHVEELNPTEQLTETINRFLTSTNFQTCIQVQCLWIDGKFEIFRVVGLPEEFTFLVRVFPSWFKRGSPDARKKWEDYRQFVHQWRSFLSCTSCGSPKCEVLSTPGEVDRCWWQALGPQNFLSRMPGRYKTFCVTSDDDNKERGLSFESLDSEGNRLRILRLKSRKADTLTFACEHWDLVPKAGCEPRLIEQQDIVAKDTPLNWRLYSNFSAKNSTAENGRVPLVTFSEECQSLRIGRHVFALNGEDKYRLISGKLTSENDPYPIYVEEFAVRGNIVILTSRREKPKLDTEDQNGLSDNTIKDFGNHFVYLEQRVPDTRVHKDHGESTETEDDSDSSSSTSGVTEYETDTDSSSDEAYETWSENSTVLSEDFVFEDDMILPAGRPTDLPEDSDTSLSDVSDGDDSGGCQGTRAHKKRGSSCGSGSSGSSDSSSDSLPEYNEDMEDIFYWNSSDMDSDNSDVEQAPFDRARNPWIKSLQGAPQASISVFDTSNPDNPRHIFRLSLPFHFMIYSSPPVIHPTNSLIVWPLGGGELLFADFEQKTYFTRRTRPSTTYTRHVSMKCHFSPDGKHLHIVALEGQTEPKSQDGSRKKSDTSRSLKLAVIITTYRLSTRKATRSPPALIHRVRVKLGPTKSVSASSLPFSLTWTSDLLYLTVRTKTLKVYRICLFPGVEAEKDTLWVARNAVLVPKKTIFLPDTAIERAVHFFPPRTGSTEARILIGSENRAPTSSAMERRGTSNEPDCVEKKPRRIFGLRLSPPVGCYVDEQRDMGGWVKSCDRTEVRDDIGIGKLDRRREKFDYEDDCDLEPYMFF